jgi:hypothetical protein
MRSTAGLLLLVAACGGGDSGEPLISGAVTGEYAGSAFTPEFGFATVYETTPIVGLGDGAVNCGSPERNDPPPGNTAILLLPSFDVATHSDVFVNLYHNVGDFEGVGSGGATVTITASSDAAVAGTVDYAYTDDEGLTYSLEGSFEVLRCP